MKRFAQRLGSLVALVLASSLLAFLFLEAAPGDFLSDAQLHPQLSEASLRALRDRYQLDQPVAIRYVHWLGGVAQGDWGRSLARDLPVLPLVASRATQTLILAGGAQAAAWILALALGWAAARRPGGALDRSLSLLASLLLSVPEIVLALAALLLMMKLGAGQTPLAPAFIALVAATSPALWRQTRAALLRAAEEPFVEAARTHSISERIVWTRYLLPAAAPTLLSLAALSIGGLLSTSLLVECVTAYPGLGPLLLDAVFARDAYVVVGAVFLSTLLWATGSLLADLAQWFIDPRLRGTS